MHYEKNIVSAFMCLYDIIFIYGNTDPVWCGSYLTCSIDNTAAVFTVQTGGEHKQPIGKVIHCFFIHKWFLQLKALQHRQHGW